MPRIRPLPVSVAGRMGLDPGLPSAVKARPWRARVQRATKLALMPWLSGRPVVLVVQRRSAAGLDLVSGNWLASVRLRLAATRP
jgi:hypothetical protein